jgi:hypothetical protein
MAPKIARLPIRILHLSFFLALSVSTLKAQDSGLLQGTVTDSEGVPVPFALVTTENLESGQVLSLSAGMNGFYRVNLATGNYSIRIESSGYLASQIPFAKIDAPWVVTENCKLLQQNSAQTAGAEDKPQNPDSDAKSQGPSLEDLGISATQSKGDAKMQALLDRRTHMLKIHQRLGLITIGPLAATLIASGFAGGRSKSSSTRDVHAALGATTWGLYSATAYFAIRAPKIPGVKAHGPIRLHKTLAWIHGPGMELTPILGEIAYQQKARGERVHGIASLHGPVAIITAGAFGLAVASVTLKF